MGRACVNDASAPVQADELPRLSRGPREAVLRLEELAADDDHGVRRLDGAYGFRPIPA